MQQDEHYHVNNVTGFWNIYIKQRCSSTDIHGEDVLTDEDVTERGNWERWCGSGVEDLDHVDHPFQFEFKQTTSNTFTGRHIGGGDFTGSIDGNRIWWEVDGLSWEGMLSDEGRGMEGKGDYPGRGNAFVGCMQEIPVIDVQVADATNIDGGYFTIPDDSDGNLITHIGHAYVPCKSCSLEMMKAVEAFGEGVTACQAYQHSTTKMKEMRERIDICMRPDAEDFMLAYVRSNQCAGLTPEEWQDKVPAMLEYLRPQISKTREEHPKLLEELDKMSEECDHNRHRIVVNILQSMPGYVLSPL